MKRKDLKDLKKKSNGRITIREINTIQSAYFKKLNWFDFVKMTGIQAVVFGAATYFLYLKIEYAIVGTVIGLLFGLFIHIPKTVKKNYQFRAYVERNRFLNNFTQLIINENMPLLDILEKIIPRLKGELYNDMTVLLARITTADSKMATEAFKDLTTKYQDDVVFAQYFEHIETVFIEGYRNIETFKELKSQHNKFLEKLESFQKNKDEYGSGFVATGLLVAFVLAILIYGIGVEIYKVAFAHEVIGTVCIGVYLVIVGLLYKKSMDYIYDDTITKL